MLELILERTTRLLIPAPDGLRAVLAHGMHHETGVTVELATLPILALAVQTVGYEDRQMGEVERIVGLIAGSGNYSESGEELKAAEDELEFLCYLNPDETLSESHVEHAKDLRLGRVRSADMDDSIEDAPVVIRTAPF